MFLALRSWRLSRRLKRLAAIAQFADLGLPFFHGRSIASGLEDSSTSAPDGCWTF